MYQNLIELKRNLAKVNTFCVPLYVFKDFLKMSQKSIFHASVHGTATLSKIVVDVIFNKKGIQKSSFIHHGLLTLATS